MKVTGPKGVAARNGSKTITVSLQEPEYEMLCGILDEVSENPAFFWPEAEFAAKLLTEIQRAVIS